MELTREILVDNPKQNDLIPKGGLYRPPNLPFKADIHQSSAYGAIIPVSESIYFSAKKHVLQLDEFQNWITALTEADSFSHIEKAINDSEFILELKDDWDDNGAIAIPPKIWHQATSFLRNYAHYVKDVFGLILSAPIISASKDGSVDLTWRISKARMLINIRNSENREAYYYGDQYKDKNSIKGNISTIVVQEFLASWMKNLTD